MPTKMPKKNQGYILQINGRSIGVRVPYNKAFLEAANADGRFVWVGMYKYWQWDDRANHEQGVPAIDTWRRKTMEDLVKLAEGFYNLSSVELCNSCQFMSLDENGRYGCCTNEDAEATGQDVFYQVACELYQLGHRYSIN